VSELEIGGVAGDLARAVATGEWLTGLLDVVLLARARGLDAEQVGARYYALGQQLDFAWVLARLGDAGEEDRWQRRAAAGLTEDLQRARRDLSLVTLGALPPRPLEAVHALVRDLRATPRVSLAALQVVVRELRRLAETVRGEESH
jgi:NAD-specific glutamate dehydrogenase